MPTHAVPSPADTTVDAARHALLRRLAPALRHEAVAHLQPIGMIGTLLERRLATPQPDLPQVRDGVQRLLASSKAAAQTCLDMVSWFAPQAGQAVPLHEAVADTLALLRSSLAFRGFTLRDELAGLAAPVDPASLRYVLPACLLWLTDSAGPPAQVTLSARVDGAQVRLQLELIPLDAPTGSLGDDGNGHDARPLRGDEVAAMARADGVAYAHDGDVIVLTVPQAL